MSLRRGPKAVGLATSLRDEADERSTRRPSATKNDGVSAGRTRRRRIRHRIEPRLGSERNDPTGRQGGHRQELRADPSQQPRRYGRTTARDLQRRSRAIEELGLTGKEQFTITGISDGLSPKKTFSRCRRRPTTARTTEFDVDRPPRYAQRSRVLPPRRNPAVRPAEHAQDRRHEAVRGLAKPGARELGHGHGHGGTSPLTGTRS